LSPDQHPAENTFYIEVYRRLIWLMAALALVGTVAAGIWYGATMALGFLAGAAIAALNLHWLKLTIEAMGGQLPTKARTARGVVVRFLLRYVLIAAAAYVILKSTANSLYGFFAGLSVPVGAILIEAVNETFRAFRTGSDIQE
jgi:hypothetical protein